MATIKDVNLDKPIEIYPCKTVGIICTPLDVKAYRLPARQVRLFVEELQAKGQLSLIEETLQGLAERADGTLLKTAFPSLAEFKAATNAGLSSLPNEFTDLLTQWEAAGATEINIDFEQLVPLIVDFFHFDDGVVEIMLEHLNHAQQHRADVDCYRIVAHWQGGGLVNGYEYRVDRISNLPLEMIASTGPIKMLIKQARADVESRLWEQYEQALKQLEAV